jgi:RNA polymerase sigma factor (sigma-70 family)
VSRDPDEVFRRLAGPVHGYLRAAGAASSEDLLHDVFVDVLQGLERFQGDDDALRRWVFTIAHHRLIDERRRIARSPGIGAQPAATEPAPAEPFDPALEAALNLLTPEQREVVVLRFVADLTLETVASMTGRSIGAVKALQHRALTRLQLALTSDVAVAYG